MPMVHRKNNQGFALLMTLIVVSVIISIGLVVLDLSLKQLRLSTNAKESEAAFHAANGGLECARYIRGAASSTMESGGTINPVCFSATVRNNTTQQITTNVSGVGNVYFYKYSFSWGIKPHCTIMNTLVMVASPFGTGLVMNTPSDYIPEYPNPSKTCAAGEKCTIISSRGFNRDCSSFTGYGSVEREVLVQF